MREHKHAEHQRELMTEGTKGRLRRGTAILGGAGLLVVGVAGGAIAAHEFSDVPDDHVFHDAIGWLADSGVTAGRGDGTFGPEDNVTRGQMAAFMQRLAGHDEDVDPVVQALSAEMADWADEAGTAESADEADWADEAGTAEMADDAAQLGGTDAEDYVDKFGLTFTQVGHGDWTPQSPNAWEIQGLMGRTRMTPDGTNISAYAQPNLANALSGDRQYLHRASFCIETQENVEVTHLSLRGYSQETDGSHEAEVVEADTTPDIDETSGESENCYFLRIDEGDSSTNTQGWEIGNLDYVQLRLRATGDGDDWLELKSVQVGTSSQETLPTLQLPDDPITLLSDPNPEQ